MLCVACAGRACEAGLLCPCRASSGFLGAIRQARDWSQVRAVHPLTCTAATTDGRHALSMHAQVICPKDPGHRHSSSANHSERRECSSMQVLVDFWTDFDDICIDIWCCRVARTRPSVCERPRVSCGRRPTIVPRVAGGRQLLGAGCGWIRLAAMISTRGEFRRYGRVYALCMRVWKNNVIREIRNVMQDIQRYGATTAGPNEDSPQGNLKPNSGGLAGR